MRLRFIRSSLKTRTSHLPLAYTDTLILQAQVPCTAVTSNELLLDSMRSTPGVAAVWVARNRFAVLYNKAIGITIKHIVNNELRIIIVCDEPVNDIFYAGTGFLLLSNTDNVKLHDIKQKCVIATAKVSKV